ncbi:hypothetical protein GCM10025864_13300 [Luteimicrobium album]|uniref:Luciferase-like domain-containing protein n=1 Tax=Luteimicrobium album TaxID=1054550 RepID=A0ABQ6HYN2_9MICO|nr:hypothetical protein GCM10025864_13300 [Luteimicrobium album]
MASISPESLELGEGTDDRRGNRPPTGRVAAGMTTTDSTGATGIDLGGRYGVWRRGLDLDGRLAATLERLGYGAVWIGGSPDATLAKPEELLAATRTLVVGTGIVNIWASPADEVAASTLRVLDADPDRFVLGIGTGHREASGAKAATPTPRSSSTSTRSTPTTSRARTSSSPPSARASWAWPATARPARTRTS